MRPYLETLFRNPRLLLLPALLLPMVALAVTFAMPKTYETSATLWVDRATEESYSASSVVLTPADEEAQEFTARLDTLSFRRQVIEDAGLAPLVTAQEWPEPAGFGRWLKENGFGPIGSWFGGDAPATAEQAWSQAADHVFKFLTAESTSDNLVSIKYAGPDHVHGQALVNAAIDRYLMEKATAAQRKVSESERVHGPLIAAMATQVDTAREAWLDFTLAMPTAPSVADTQKAAELETVYRDQLARLEEMQLTQDAAALSAVRAWTNTTPNATLIDSPDSPQATLGVMGFAKFAVMAGVVGTFLGAVLVVLRTWIDRALRIPEDVYKSLDTPVLAVLPLIKDSRTEFGRGH